ncbi:MAG: DAK2 domain-containing protein [Dehalococcoidales bacterium]
MKTGTMEKSPDITFTGRELREMFCMATRCLEKNTTVINALNVFPVPDGDTGTNMLLTMRSTMAEAAKPPDSSASDIAEAMAKGALMGARGNSGVILSQIMRGFAKGFAGQDSFGPNEMADALYQASLSAYEGLSRPCEGTMLTVIKDVAAAARKIADNDTNLANLMEAVAAEAHDSVERTPELLDVLKEAGVVDAGGQGVYVLLEGVSRYLHGDEELIELPEQEAPVMKQPAFIAAKAAPRGDEAYGFCTEMLIKDAAVDKAQIRKWVESMGDSVLVVGDENNTKIHVHTCHPGAVLEFAISVGTVHDLKIQNMDDQHEDFVQLRRAPAPATSLAVIAVVAGAGLEDVFHSLGTNAVIRGGQTMNPSCAEIAEAINSVASDRIIVLPNNKNVIPAAQQAATMAKKKVTVLSTRSVPQGLAALLAYNSEGDLDTNVSEMTRAVERVRSIEVTRAVRDAKIDDLNIKTGNFISLVDGSIRVASKSLLEAVEGAFETIDATSAEIASLYYGDDITAEEATCLCQSLKEKYPNIEFEMIQGGQPHYSCIISVE